MTVIVVGVITPHTFRVNSAGVRLLRHGSDQTYD